MNHIIAPKKVGVQLAIGGIDGEVHMKEVPDNIPDENDKGEVHRLVYALEKVPNND